MKYFNYLRIIFVTLFLVFISLNAYSQEQQKQTTSSKLPSEDGFGVGVAIQGNETYGETTVYGAQGAYVLKSNLHLGVSIGAYYVTATDEDKGKLYLYLAPYLKFILEPIRHFYPLIIGKFEVSTRQEEYKDVKNVSQVRDVTSTSVSASLGGEWFPYSSVGVFGGVKVLTFEFDPSKAIIGIGQPFLGIEWFL